MKKGLAAIFIIAIVFLAIAVSGTIGFFVARNIAGNAGPSPVPVSDSPSPPAVEKSPLPTPVISPTPVSNIPVGWLTYKNTKYGFEISYPKTWKALDDKDNLYGWPDAAVLLYNGGQSYDIPIEVWDGEAQYKAKYTSQKPIVYKVGEKFITLVDVTSEPDAQAIISTFKISN